MVQDDEGVLDALVQVGLLDLRLVEVRVTLQRTDDALDLLDGRLDGADVTGRSVAPRRLWCGR